MALSRKRSHPNNNDNNNHHTVAVADKKRTKQPYSIEDDDFLKAVPIDDLKKLLFEKWFEDKLSLETSSLNAVEFIAFQSIDMEGLTRLLKLPGVDLTFECYDNRINCTFSVSDVNNKKHSSTHYSLEDIDRFMSTNGGGLTDDQRKMLRHFMLEMFKTFTVEQEPSYSKTPKVRFSVEFKVKTVTLNQSTFTDLFATDDSVRRSFEKVEVFPSHDDDFILLKVSFT